MKIKIKCIFCKQKFYKEFYVYNYLTSKFDGKFYECKHCVISINLKTYKKLYNNQDSTNYNLKKNFFFYLKQFFFIIFIIKINRFFLDKKKILDYGCGSGEFANFLSLFFKKKIFILVTYLV
jgi:2-polyprenyl-3-methyl-5-hydroxy-6-metoxy-1,4-benzoquinol methylase